MKKTDYINKYNKQNYKIICLALKPHEKDKLDMILNKHKISLRKYILLKLDEEGRD